MILNNKIKIARGNTTHPKFQILVYSYIKKNGMVLPSKQTYWSMK